MEIPPGSVVITTTEMYREMKATHDNVTAMRGELQAIAEAVPDHEARIRALEKSRWWVGGLATGAGAGLAEVLRLIGKG